MTWPDPRRRCRDHDPAGRTRHRLAPYARRHRGALITGLAFTVALVACRLALPLPLGQIVDGSAGGARPRPAEASWLAAGFVALALAAGAAEHWARLAFANFTNRTVGDARDAATASREGSPDDVSGRATQLAADSARVKQGLKGVLNHIVLNALLVLGAAVAVLVIDGRLGVVLLCGVTLLVAVGILGGVAVTGPASDHRDEETALARTIQGLAGSPPATWRRVDLDDLHRLDDASGRADVDLTRWETRSTWVAHGLLAAVIGVVLVAGLSAVTDGRLTTGDLFRLGGYLLVLHGPGIRLARQLCRVGAVRVSARHLCLALPPAPGAAGADDGGGHAAAPRRTG